MTERDRVPIPSAHCIREVARHQDLTQALAVMRNEEFGPEALRLRPARCKDGTLARRVQIAVGGRRFRLGAAAGVPLRDVQIAVDAAPAREQRRSATVGERTSAGPQPGVVVAFAASGCLAPANSALRDLAERGRAEDLDAAVLLS